MIAEFCIRRPVFTILLMVAIIVGGISGFVTLPVSALPNVDFPTIAVSATLPGASPETMASSVATPLEKQFSTIAGISSMTSTSFLGNTQITLQFDLDRSIDAAALDVQTAISAAVRQLPVEMSIPPSLRKVNPATQPIIYIALSSDTLPISTVDEFADNIIAQRLSTISGVAQVLIYGHQKYAIRVQVDPNKLSSQKMSFENVKQALTAAFSNTPVGTINGDKQLFNILVKGQPNNAKALGELIAVWKNGAPIRFKDVANVVDSVEDNKAVSFVNGKKNITLAIQRQPDANTIEVIEEIKRLMPILKSQIPAAIETTVMFDRSVSIKNSVHDVQLTLLATIVLVILVIFIFLRNIHTTLIPAIAVPLSIVATYGGMALFGFSINNISLLALTLCVGFVVDDAIVMLENIIRHVENGKKVLEAALLGAREITFTIISITFSLVAVFMPVLFMGGIVGRVFHEFAVTISIAILASGLVSLTLTPMLCSRILKPYNSKNEKPYARKLEAWYKWLLSKYDGSLKWVLNHDRLMLVITITTLLVSVVVFIFAPKSFFPLEDVGLIFAQTEGSQDTSYEAMIDKQKQVAELIKADQAVDRVSHSLGGSRGALNSGVIFIGLKDRKVRDSVFEVIARLRTNLKAIEGINVYMQPVQNIQLGGRLTKSMYQYTLQGSNLKELYEWADKLVETLKHHTVFQDITSDIQLKSLEAVIDVDQQRAASLGVNFNDIRQGLYNAFGTLQVGTLYMPSNNYAVILEIAEEFQKTPNDISKLYINGANNNLVPLDAFASINRSFAPLSVNHQGQLPAVTISFNLSKGISLSTALSELETIKKDLKIPQSIVGGFQGSAQIFQDSIKNQGLLIFLSVIVIYIILGMLYESFIHPITILSGLPSAAIGAVIALLILGMDISTISLIGIILLIGLVKKNSIMIVDFAIQLKAKGVDSSEAIYQACLLRFRPIMMTTIAALIGTLPIALGLGAGAELRQPLGVAVVGGLLISQFLTLYITPVVYLYLEKVIKILNHKPLKKA